ncbi:MAG: FAD-dependent oxidoreductase [Chthoniobacteraceae bacterium]
MRDPRPLRRRCPCSRGRAVLPGELRSAVSESNPARGHREGLPLRRSLAASASRRDGARSRQRHGGDRHRCGCGRPRGKDRARREAHLGVDVFLGGGQFTGPDTIAVKGATLRFAKAVIATGARAAAPPIPGLSDVPYLTNETLFSLTELPRRLAIIGAGLIGCEMAQSFARLGSEVHLIASTRGILPREDRDAAAILQAQMQRDGVKIVINDHDLRLSRNGADVRLRLSSKDAGSDIVVDQLLVAVGRAPNVEGLGLETVGVEFDSKGVKVNDRLQTASPRIYACGDICSRYQFTHAAGFMARIVIQNAARARSSWAGQTRVRSRSRGRLTPRRRTRTSACMRMRRGNRASRSSACPGQFPRCFMAYRGARIACSPNPSAPQERAATNPRCSPLCRMWMNDPISPTGRQRNDNWRAFR